MTILEAVGVYATIVQLVGQFKQERKDQSEMSDQDFLTWLTSHHHEPITKAIQTNRELQTGIAKLLRQDNRSIIGKIDELGTMLATVAAQVGEFRGVLAALTPAAHIEPDALALLRELVEKDWQRFGLSGSGRNLDFLMHEGKCEPFNIPDGGTQFLEQDLMKLAELGFLEFKQWEYQKNFALTRAAYQYAAASKASSPGSKTER